LPAKVFQFTMGRESREKLVLKVGPSWIGDCCRLDWTADCSWKFVNFTKLKLSYFHFLPDANLLEYAAKYAAFFFLDVQLSRAEILFCPFNRTPKPQMQLEFCVAWIFLALCFIDFTRHFSLSWENCFDWASDRPNSNCCAIWVMRAKRGLLSRQLLIEGFWGS